MTCEKCGDEIEVGSWPFCRGKGSHGKGSYIVEGDEIDVEIKHALCNPDGTPRRFRSREALKRSAKEAGWTNYVRHVGTQGGDRSKHTQRFV